MESHLTKLLNALLENFFEGTTIKPVEELSSRAELIEKIRNGTLK